MRQVARDLGVSYESVRKWVHQADIYQSRKDGLTTEEREELRAFARRTFAFPGAGDPENSRGLLCPRGAAAEPAVMLGFVQTEKATYDVKTMCQLGVSRSGFLRLTAVGRHRPGRLRRCAHPRHRSRIHAASRAP